MKGSSRQALAAGERRPREHAPPWAATRPGASPLRAAGTLGAHAVITGVASTELSAPGTLRAIATAGPDLGRLWNDYLSASAAAALARQNWEMVKGSPDEGIYWYQRYYAADQKQIAAYGTWLAARNASQGIITAPRVPGVS